MLRPRVRLPVVSGIAIQFCRQISQEVCPQSCTTSGDARDPRPGQVLEAEPDLFGFRGSVLSYSRGGRPRLGTGRQDDCGGDHITPVMKPPPEVEGTQGIRCSRHSSSAPHHLFEVARS